MTVTTVLVAVASGSITLSLALLAFLLLRRDRPDDRLAVAIGDLNTRMEGLVREMSLALESPKQALGEPEILGELAGTIDLDEVAARVLEAAGALPGVDAALVTIEVPGDKPIVATLGLSAEETERHAVAGPPDGRHARSISMSYDYPADATQTDLIRSGLAVPISGETGDMGFLTVFSRARSHVFSDPVLHSLEHLSGRAGPAIENARRFREARALADLDALTGLHNRRYFHETLAREVSRAHRYDRGLALIVFDLDDFKAINDRIGHLAGDAVLAEVAERARSVVRAADIACRVGGDEFAVIMPESTMRDAEQLSRRMQGAVSSRAIDDAGNLRLSAGAAELTPEDDATSFFQRADDALYRAKEAGKGQIATNTG